MLTKTNIKAGIQCVKRLWLHKNISQVPPRSRYAEFMGRQGDAVELEAYKKFPNGQCATLEDRGAEIGHTEKLMADGAECLFQPSFSADGIRVRCDILRKRNGAWDIIEVKSSSLKKDEKKDKLKDEHIADLAVQWHVLKNADIPLGGAFLMLVNNSGECVFPDLSKLMLEMEVTDQVRARAAEISGLLREFEAALGSPDAPDIPIGEHCTKPQKCQFMGHCWKDMPKASIHTIPRLGWKKKKDMMERGVLLAADADVKLTEPQQRYVDIVRSGKPVIDTDGIRAQLDKLEFPLHFLDFETMSPAIPRIDGMRPYQHFPFQFSCHILRTENGEVEHHKYLHRSKDTDPLPPLLSHLADCVGRTGSIVVWHGAAEKGFLKELASYATKEQKELLDGMAGRLWDLELVFAGKKDDAKKKDGFPPLYRHHDFLGRTSLKAVLPALTDKSYDGLEIKDGKDAMGAWDLTIHGKEDYTKELLEYCHLDTEAMVLIYRHLVCL